MNDKYPFFSYHVDEFGEYKRPTEHLLVAEGLAYFVCQLLNLDSYSFEQVYWS